MNTTIHTSGHAYTSDVDYAKFTGRVVKKHVEKLGITLDGFVIGRVVRIIDLGRSDTVKPNNPELVIADDGTDPDGNPRHKHAPLDRTTLVIEQIHSLLEEKPLSTGDIARALGETVARIKGILDNHHEGLEILGKVRTGHVYALAGKQYKERFLFQSMPKIVEFLKANGPASITDICKGTGLVYANIYTSVDANPGVMAVVGQRRGKTKIVQIWGLVGIHDKQGVAA